MLKNHNPLHDDALRAFRGAYKKTKAPIWRDAEKRIQKSRSRRTQVNLNRIAKATDKNDVVLVPGKVLGGGSISHKLVVGAFSFSEAAFNGISSAGGETLFIQEFTERYPKGKGVKLIDG